MQNYPKEEIQNLQIEHEALWYALGGVVQLGLLLAWLKVNPNIYDFVMFEVMTMPIMILILSNIIKNYKREHI